MNADDIFKAITQTVILAIESYINKILDEKLEAFKSQLTSTQQDNDLSHSEFDKLIQHWLENHNITQWVDENDLALDDVMDSWAQNNLDVSNEVDDYFSNNFDINDIVRDAIKELTFEVTVS